MRTDVDARAMLGLPLTVAALALAGLVACASDPPAPGFEQVGGAGEGGAASASTTTSSSQSSSATSSVASSSSASSTTASSATSSSSSGGLDCGEGPGPDGDDTEASATDLGTIGDCDGDGESVTGVLTGFGDVDWYRYLGDDGLCVVSPSRALVASHAVRLCKYVQCVGGQEPDIECPNGTEAATSPDGRPGCCGSSGFDLDAGCAGLIGDDSMRIYLSVETEQQACVEYTIDYHF
jgi:hypothetical protein